MVDVKITRGARFAHTFTWRTTAGAAVNVTGYSAEFTLNDRSGAEILSVTSPTSITLGGTAGTVVVTLTEAQTTALDRATDHAGTYSLVLTSPGGAVTVLSSGRAAVLEVAGL